MTFLRLTTEPEGSPGDLVSNRNHAAEEGTEEPEAATESEGCLGVLAVAGKTQGGNHAEEEGTEGVKAAAEPEGCPGDLDGKTKAGNHAEEEKTEELVAATWSSLCGHYAPDEAEDDGSESPKDKMSCFAGDVPKYDDIDDDDEDGDAVDFGEEGDKVKGDDTDKSRAKDPAGVPFDEEMANRCSLLLLSLVLMVAMPAVVWCSFSQPLILVWRLSLLLCSCFAIWTGLLAVTLSSQTVLLRIALVFALALYVDAVLEPKFGMLMMHFNSQFAVGMMGYALAEHRQHNGTEVSAKTVCIPSDEKKANTLLCAQMIGGAYFGMITVGFAVGLWWLLLRNVADYAAEDLVMCVFLPLSGVLVLWIIYVGSMLVQGALIGETGFCVLMTYLVLMTILCALFVMTMGGIWAMILAWPLKLGLSGLFGYCICVHATFKLRMKQGLVPMKQNESKEGSSLGMLPEKQGHGNEDLHPGNNNVISSSFSTRKEAGVKPKLA